MGHPRLYLSVTFWGEKYRRYFLDYCLASLLAPGNIPALADKQNSRLLIATPDPDWAAMQSEPTFLAAKSLIQIEHVPHNFRTQFRTRDDVMLTMSAGHALLAQRMFEDRAYGTFLYPDALLADGGLARLQELAHGGVKVVLCLAVRFANEGLLGERALDVTPGSPLRITPKELARLTIKHMHSETRRCHFDAKAYDYGSSAYFWTVRRGRDLVFHSGNWAPMLIDYGALARHDASTFERWTLDGDYIHRNFPDPNDIYVVRNTRELFISGFTPESEVHYSLAPHLAYRFKWVRESLKIRMAHQFLYSRNVLDSVKRELFSLPIRMQGGRSPEIAWRHVERRAAGIVKKIANNEPAASEILINRLFDIAFRTVKFGKFMLNIHLHARDYALVRLRRWNSAMLSRETP